MKSRCQPHCPLLGVAAVLLLGGLALAAADADRRANTVILDETAVKNLGLETVEASENDFEETVFVLGRIEVLPGNAAVVSSRVPGRAIAVPARPDHAVEKGDEVVLVESRQPGDPPPTISLKAPIDGLVSEIKVVPGQPISPDDTLISIINLDEVYAVAQVPEYLAASLRPGLKAHIRVPALPKEIFEAELLHIGAMADRDAAAIEAAFHVPNPQGLLRPGMRAEFSIVLSARAGVMSVPREAVQGDAAGRFLYIADYELKNAYVKVPVVLGAQNDRFVEVVKGLLPGDEVVTRGAYALGFAGKGSISLKEALDAAHGHPHNEDGSEMTKEQQAAAQGAARAGGGSAWTPLTTFFAGTTGLLFVLLLAAIFFRRPPASA